MDGLRIMQSFKQLVGLAAPLERANIDTDLIIPKQFLKTTSRKGLGKFIFHDLRTMPDGSANPDFILNKSPWCNTSIIIAGKNFGCGSSREHAPWALADFGIRCVIASSFADIFFNNCFKNGILPLVLKDEEVAKLLKLAQLEVENNKTSGFILEVNLESQEVKLPDGTILKFNVDPFRRECLLQGLDDIGLTEKHIAAIASTESRLEREQPWIFHPSAAR